MVVDTSDFRTGALIFLGGFRWDFPSGGHPPNFARQYGCRPEWRPQGDFKEPVGL